MLSFSVERICFVIQNCDAGQSKIHDLFFVSLGGQASLHRRGLFFSGAKEEISRLAVPAANEADFNSVPIFFPFFSIRLLVVTSKCFSP